MAEIRWININIGCIETKMFSKLIMSPYVININIGCIETNEFDSLVSFCYKININIGCIETPTAILSRL